MSEEDYWAGWTWFWIFFIVFFLIIIIAVPWGYYSRSDYCGDELPPVRYSYRPSRVVEIEE
jgi:hypothetical protein